jgi:signal transduction histidine kinase
VLPERHRDKEFIHQFSEIVPKELDSWQVSLQNMMDFSTKKKYVMEEIDLNTVLNDVIHLSQLRAMQDKVIFEMDFQKNLPSIRGNEDRLRQVFLNLLTNSLQAAPENKKIRLITRFEQRLSPDSPMIVIKVINQGSISVEDLSRIFEPFYTTKANGLGLGLAISREIILQHSGTIEAHLTDNQDVCFEVRIPAIEGHVFLNRIGDMKVSENERVL